jgi:exonuclease III
MKNLIVTTFNVLNRIEHAEERYTKILTELDEHQSDVALLQEVRQETLGLLKEKSAAQGWWMSAGVMSEDHKDSRKIYGNVTLTRKSLPKLPLLFFIQMMSKVCQFKFKEHCFSTTILRGVLQLSRNV